MHWNVNKGFSFKQFIVLNQVQLLDIQVACISEIGLYYSEKVRCDGYTIYAESIGHNHGVAIVVRDDLAHAYLGDLGIRNTCWIRVSVQDGQDILIGCIYNPPTSRGVTVELSQALSEFHDCDILMQGDWNMNPFEKNEVTEFAMHLGFNIVTDGEMSRKGRRGQQDTLIDFSVSSVACDSYACDWQLDDSDHRPIVCSLDTSWMVVDESAKQETVSPYARRYKLHKMDVTIWQDVIAEGLLPWISRFEESNDVESMWKSFLEIVHEKAQVYIGLKYENTLRERSKTAPRWTPRLAFLKAKRNRLLKRYKNFQSLINETEWREARAAFRRELRYVRDRMMKRMAAHKKLLKQSSFQFSSICGMDGVPIMDAFEAASTVNEFTANVGYDTKFDPSTIPDRLLNPIRAKARPQSNCFSDPIESSEVVDAVKKIKRRKACGIDQLPGELIKAGGDVMIEALSLLFNAVWRTGQSPLMWKTGVIKPLPKENKKQLQCDKLRPICLLPIVSKVMERIVKTRLATYLETNELLVDEQSGFRQHRNTVDNMVRLAEHAYWAKTKKQIGVMVSLDISKAYDSVNRDLLKFLMRQYGISDRMLMFLHNFLDDRYGCVQLFGKVSDQIRYDRGVPQGAVLSPVLFNLVINLICEDVTVCKSLFADDVNLWCFDVDRPTIVRSMNAALQIMMSNASTLLLKFAVHKCKAMWFFCEDEPSDEEEKDRAYGNALQPSTWALHMNGVSLPVEKHLRFLGIEFDKSLSFKDHISTMMKKCNQRLWMIKRYSPWFTRTDLLEMYHLWIRSLLDYGCLVYNMASERLLHAVDQFQSKCLRVLLQSGQLCSGAMIEVETGFCPLDIRRQQLAMSYIVKRLALKSGDTVRQCIQDALVLSTDSRNVKRNDSSCLVKVLYRMQDSRHSFDLSRETMETIADESTVLSLTSSWALQAWEHQLHVRSNQSYLCKPYAEFGVSLERLTYPNGLPKQVERTWHRLMCNAIHVRARMDEMKSEQVVNTWCRFCGQDLETLEHILLDCTHLQVLLHLGTETHQDARAINSLETFFQTFGANGNHMAKVYALLKTVGLHN